MNLYTVYDRVAKLHFPPLMAPNDETAMRRLRASVNGGDPNFTQSHQDYDLFKVAAFDEHTGITVGCEPVVHVCTATSLKES